MRMTDAERLILLNQTAIMKCLAQKGQYLGDHVEVTERLLERHHTPLQVADALHRLRTGARQ